MNSRQLTSGTLRDTSGSPARGAGSNCKLLGVEENISHLITLSVRWSHSQGIFEVLVDLHDGSLVAAPVAVIGRGEDSDDVSLLTPVEAIHDKLMSATDECETIVVVESF